MRLCSVSQHSYSQAKNTIADLEIQNQALATENIRLQEKAARELSGAWSVNRLAVGAIAALALIQEGRLVNARDWLLESLEGIDIDIPTYQSDAKLNECANTHQVGYLNHNQALEIIKRQTPVTTQYFNEIKAQGVDALITNIEDEQMHYEEDDWKWMKLASNFAIAFATSLRQGEHHG